jgi:Xaa-Pro aminopeptidase
LRVPATAPRTEAIVTQQSEHATKRARLATWLAEHGADAVLLIRMPNVNWLASGCELRRAAPRSLGFVVTASRCWLLAPADEIERLRQEEVRGLDLELVALPLLGATALVERARTLVAENARWRCDRAGLGMDVDASLETLRLGLCRQEIDRLRRLGHDAAAAVDEVAAECFRGMLERDVAARLAAELVRRQMVPRALLVGADERLESYARPLPKSGSAERLLLLGVLAMRGGLHVALSRLACLVPPPEGLVERHNAAGELLARLCHEARPGEELGAVVRRALPQPVIHTGSLGGVVGYAVPEIEATPTNPWRLAAGQPLAWSVGAPGVRCEDTVLVTDAGCETLTTSEGWPRRTVLLDGSVHEVPDLLLI